MAQRWLLVYSEQAYIREKKTQKRKIEKEEEGLKKALYRMMFFCEADALKSINLLQKSTVIIK